MIRLIVAAAVASAITLFLFAGVAATELNKFEMFSWVKAAKRGHGDAPHHDAHGAHAGDEPQGDAAPLGH